MNDEEELERRMANDGQGDGNDDCPHCGAPRAEFLYDRPWQQQELVDQFMRALKQNRPSFPTLAFPIRLRVNLIVEEASEFQRAANRGDWVEMIDALCDLLYVTHGAGSAMGVDLHPFFQEVHRTNMEKTGGPVRPSDGKILKPEGWKPPDIAGMLCDLLGQSIRASLLEPDMDGPTRVRDAALRGQGLALTAAEVLDLDALLERL